MTLSYHKEVADVVEANERHVWISAVAQSTCQGCSANATCGTGVLSKVLGKKRLMFQLDNALGARQGDRVVVQIPSKGVFLGALVLYILPLVFLFFSAIILQMSGFDESYVIAGGITGLLSGLVLARYIAKVLEKSSLSELKIIAIQEPNIVLQIE